MDEPNVVVERWLSVVGHEGSYEVSDQGRVRSMDRVVVDSRGRTLRRRGRILKLTTTSFGYKAVGIVGVTRTVHQMVMESFVGPPPPGLECCHDNGDPSDNRLSNLRYDTHSGNMWDRVRHGRHPAMRRTHCPTGHVLREPNLIPGGSRRACRACSYARARAWQAEEAGRSVDLDDLKAECYAEIMSGRVRLSGKEKTHCPSGHLLSVPNLTAHSMRMGHRSCLACSRARARAQKAERAGRPYDLAALKAQCYAEIMNVVPATPYAVLV